MKSSFLHSSYETMISTSNHHSTPVTALEFLAVGQFTVKKKNLTETNIFFWRRSVPRRKIRPQPAAYQIILLLTDFNSIVTKNNDASKFTPTCSQRDQSPAVTWRALTGRGAGQSDGRTAAARAVSSALPRSNLPRPLRNFNEIKLNLNECK